jgi:hypothetical protein
LKQSATENLSHLNYFRIFNWIKLIKPDSLGQFLKGLFCAHGEKWMPKHLKFLPRPPFKKLPSGHLFRSSFSSTG